VYNLVILASKPNDWTHDQFIEWWRGEHADMTYGLPGLLRWHHTEIAEAMDDKLSAGWDGLSVLSFDSKESLEAALASDEWRRAVEHVGPMRGRRIALMGAERVMVAAQ
jgi:uncharacterized protein (TIGR02118 family)